MIIGIDPGKSGGIAIIDEDRKIIDCLRMPTMRHGKREIVDAMMLNRRFGMHSPKAVVIEQVSAMPGQGVTSMFNFGRHVGVVEGWALTIGCPVQWVTPAVWKKAFSLSREKRASLDRARLEFGDHKIWDVLANDGIAEAALIALWYHNTTNR